MPKGQQGRERRRKRRAGMGERAPSKMADQAERDKPQPARSGAASRVNSNIMKNYESPVQFSNYHDLLLQRGLYVEPMHNDEYCCTARQLLSQRLLQLGDDPTPLMEGEHRWLLELFTRMFKFLILMFPRHSQIGDVGDTMGVSCSLLMFDCMCLVLSCYVKLAGGLDVATHSYTDGSDVDLVKKLLCLHGPEVYISRYSQVQVFQSWELLARRSRDTWPSEAVRTFRWCLLLRTADLCTHAERGDLLEPMLDAQPHYCRVEEMEDGGRWKTISPRCQQEWLFFIVQTEIYYVAINDEILPLEYLVEDKRPVQQYRDRRSTEKRYLHPLDSTHRKGTEMCEKVLGQGCTFRKISDAFLKHFDKTCDGTSNETFVKAMARRWADTLIYPGAKCYAFFQNKYSIAPDTSEVLRFLYSVALRTWIEHTLPRQSVRSFIDDESTGYPVLADVGRSMLMQQIVGMHSSEIAWDEECYVDESKAATILLPAYCTRTNERGYQVNNTIQASFDLGETEVWSLDTYKNTWTVPIRDRDSRKIPVVVRMCGMHWVYFDRQYYRCESLCHAFVLWILFIVSYTEGTYYRPNGDRFDMGFMMSTLEELWNSLQLASAPSRARTWEDSSGRQVARGKGMLVVKKRVEM